MEVSYSLERESCPSRLLVKSSEIQRLSCDVEHRTPPFKIPIALLKAAPGGLARAHHLLLSIRRITLQSTLFQKNEGLSHFPGEICLASSMCIQKQSVLGKRGRFSWKSGS